jgi:hypothetical protein
MTGGYTKFSASAQNKGEAESSFTLTLDELEKLITKKANQLMNEQKELDKASERIMESQKGGGILTLDDPKISNPNGVYDNVATGILDLAVRKERGEAQAGRIYDALWEKAVKSLKANPNQEFHVFGCINCHNGITPKQVYENDGRCPICRTDIESQKNRGLDV